MNCPSCNKPAIQFTKWCKKRNAFSTNCMSCGAPLKANAYVYAGFIISVALILILLAYKDDIWTLLAFHPQTQVIEIMSIILVGFIPTFLTWKIGNYKLKASASGPLHK